MSHSIFDDTMVNLAWPEIEAAAARGASVLLPLGIIEEHGPHLGLAVDTYTAYLLAVMSRRELGNRGLEAVIAPSLYWGISAGTSAFAGTFTVRKDTAKALIVDVLASLARWKFKRVFGVNWHADYHHCKTILEALSEAQASTGIDARLLVTPYDLRRLRLTGDETNILTMASVPPVGESSQYVDLHAGALETGIMLEYFPEHVNAGLAKTLKGTALVYEDLKVLGQSDEETRKVIPQGFFGNPAAANPRAARQHVEAFTGSLVDAIEKYVKKLE